MALGVPCRECDVRSRLPPLSRTVTDGAHDGDTAGRLGRARRAVRVPRADDRQVRDPSRRDPPPDRGGRVRAVGARSHPALRGRRAAGVAAAQDHPRAALDAQATSAGAQEAGPRTRVPNRSASTGTRSSTPWNMPAKSRSGGQPQRREPVAGDAQARERLVVGAAGQRVRQHRAPPGPPRAAPRPCASTRSPSNGDLERRCRGARLDPTSSPTSAAIVARSPPRGRAGTGVDRRLAAAGDHVAPCSPRSAGSGWWCCAASRRRTSRPVRAPRRARDAASSLGS